MESGNESGDPVYDMPILSKGSNKIVKQQSENNESKNKRILQSSPGHRSEAQRQFEEEKRRTTLGGVSSNSVR